MAQNYKLDKERKIITATINKLNSTEKEIVQMYINAGYELHMGKSNPWNKKAILKWYEDNKLFDMRKAFEADVKPESEGGIGWAMARKKFFEFKKRFEEEKKAKEEKA